MPTNHHLSKKDALHHHAKMGLWELGRQMTGGQPLDQAEHDRLKAMHEHADSLPHQYMCAIGGELFEPKGVPDNTEVRIFANKVLVPGGRFVLPEHPPNDRTRVMEIPIAICAEHGGAAIARFIELDWHAEPDPGGNDG